MSFFYVHVHGVYLLVGKTGVWLLFKHFDRLLNVAITKKECIFNFIEKYLTFLKYRVRIENATFIK